MTYRLRTGMLLTFFYSVQVSIAHALVTLRVSKGWVSIAFETRHLHRESARLHGAPYMEKIMDYSTDFCFSLVSLRSFFAGYCKKQVKKLFLRNIGILYNTLQAHLPICESTWFSFTVQNYNDNDPCIHVCKYCTLYMHVNVFFGFHILS